MGLVGNIGFGLYYAGMAIMVISLLLLVGAVASEVGAISTQMKVSSQKPASAAGCASASGCVGGVMPGYDNPFDMAMYPADQFLGGGVDTALGQFGVGQLADDPVSGTLYAQIRHFFIHMVAGLLVMLLGMALRLIDSFVGLFGSGKGQKEKSQRMRERLGVMAQK